MSSLCAISAVTDLFTVRSPGRAVLHCTSVLYRSGALYTHCTPVHLAALSVGTYKVAAALIMGRGDPEYWHKYQPLIGQCKGDLASDWSENCHGILMTLSQPLISEMSTF